ncbi:hypothetical protein CC1G_11598 [Coprinopsis cinerea okayama7|uniref:Uncharacterized protein n=1 Tax=Coprinopsis cinerea (strain Okayama-7 / 130 / ATCC MYA-4618 / FGSC 9003) TaxID=240176 RepID=A8NMM4_COPC7|nr:hypothetical protein CC1G_11598 [Coprinopsis cinerea okayama7\|eukprot:XP_001834949.2 hypothetical protein CC1G_11598 [Coprinopsis cinerea okayama7\
MMLHSFTKLSCILLALLQICGCIVSAGPIKRAEPAFAPKSPAAGSPQPARGPSLAARSGGKTSVQKPKAPVLGKPLKKNGHMDVNPPSSSSSATSESGMRVAEETRGGSGLVILLVLGLSIMSLRRWVCFVGFIWVDFELMFVCLLPPPDIFLTVTLRSPALVDGLHLFLPFPTSLPAFSPNLCTHSTYIIPTLIYACRPLRLTIPVVVAGPLPRNWYRISVITNNPHPELKGYDPREKISKYLDPSVKGLGGTISLGIPRLVEGRVINIWKRRGYGETPPLRADKLAMLKQDINAHTRGSWFQPLTRRALEIDEVD